MKKVSLLFIVVTLLLVPFGSTLAQDEPVELVFWSMWNENEPQAQVIQAWIEAFEAEHPNITISSVWNGRENQTKARTALAAGTTIDFVDQDGDQIAGGLMIEGAGYPLTEFLDQPALDEDVPFRDVFVPGVLDMYEVDGEYYLMPYIYNTVQFWYNKDIFEEAGVEIPETWYDLMAACDAILEAGYNPIATESDIGFYQGYFLVNIIARIKGPDFLVETIEDETGEMWRDPVYLQAAEMSRELWDRGCIAEEFIGYLWPAGQQTLAFGETAMEIVGSWLPIELASLVDEGFRWGAFNFPAIEGGEGSVNDLEVALLAFMILKDTEHPEEAFEFLKFIMVKENQQMMADEALVGVTRLGVEWAEPIADGAVAAANAETLFGDAAGGMVFYTEFVNNILFENYRHLFVGEITPEEFVEAMATDAAEYWESQ